MREGIGNKILRFNAIFFVSTNLSKTEKGNNQNINFEFYKVYTRKGNLMISSFKDVGFSYRALYSLIFQN